MNSAHNYGKTNFIVDEIKLDKGHPYTVELSGFLAQEKMLSHLEGCCLDVKYPMVLSEKELEFVEDQLRNYFSDGKKIKKEIIKIELPIVIHVPDNIGE